MLTPEEADIKDKGLVLILKELHDRLDALVFEAYGWPADLSDEQILEKLVALNAACAAQEKAGRIEWLRPDYQIPQVRLRGRARPPRRGAAPGARTQACRTGRSRPSTTTSRR